MNLEEYAAHISAKAKEFGTQGKRKSEQRDPSVYLEGIFFLLVQILIEMKEKNARPL